MEIEMKKLAAFILMIIMAAGVLTACTAKNGGSGQDGAASGNAGQNAQSTDPGNTSSDSGKDSGVSDQTADTGNQGISDQSQNNDAASSDSSGVTAEEGLKVTTEVSDGWSEKNGVYTITSAGEYSFEGNLSEGRIVVKAKGQEVSVILAGVTLSSAQDSVIYVEDAEEVTVVAQNGSINTLNDNRPRKVGNSELAGNACIYSKDDLSVQGKGTLIINAQYNKGIHTKNDLKIKNLTLNVTAVGTAIQGNDSVEIKSGNLTLVSSDDDGIKTKDTDVSSKGKQRGVVTIESGTVSITAKDECINAAYDIQISAEATVTQNKY